jgi:hypothetical protein
MHIILLTKHDILEKAGQDKNMQQIYKTMKGRVAIPIINIWSKNLVILITHKIQNRHVKRDSATIHI